MRALGDDAPFRTVGMDSPSPHPVWGHGDGVPQLLFGAGGDVGPSSMGPRGVGSPCLGFGVVGGDVPFGAGARFSQSQSGDLQKRSPSLGPGGDGRPPRLGQGR